MNDAGTPWELRAIPSPGAAVTAARTAEDGHQLLADLHGRGARHNEPYRLVLACEPLLYIDDDDVELGPQERWPTFVELADAADFLIPGQVLSLQFFSNPEGVPRVEVPPGARRAIEVTQIGELKQPGQIELVQA